MAKAFMRKKVLTGVLIALFLACLVGIAWFMMNREDENEDQSTAPAESVIASGETDTNESSTATGNTQEQVSEPAETQTASQAAADPREDVFAHYQNIVIIDKVNNYLNVRDQPGTNGVVIGKILKYGGADVLERLDNGWLRVKSGGIEGYIAEQYCTTGDAAKALALEYSLEMVEVTAEVLNVRSGPGKEYDVWAQLNVEEKYVVEGEDGEWLKISFNSTEGYIHKDYVKSGYFLMEAMPWSSVMNYSPNRQALINYAEQFIGTPYVFGGTNLWSGIDCSSYTQQCFANSIGISLPRTSREQVHVGTAVSLTEAKAGDLLFYADATGTIDHVAIYLGDGKIIHAARSLGQVFISTYNYSTEPVAIRNIIGE